MMYLLVKTEESYRQIGILDDVTQSHAVQDVLSSVWSFVDYVA